MMALRTQRSTFRKAAIGVATAATIFSAASPAIGGDVVSLNGSAVTSPCDKYGSSDKSVRCEIQRLDQRIKDANARGAAADARGAAADARAAAADKEMDCTQSIIAIINSGPDGKSRVKTALGGKSMRDVNACTLLSTLSKS